MPDGTSQILIHLRWEVAAAAEAPLTAEGRGRLPSYVQRYAETLGARVHAVGGQDDHLHVLLDIPPTKTLQSVEDELRRASQRFLRDVLGDRSFAWAEGGRLYISVSPSEQEAVAEYVQLQDDHHANGDLWGYLESGAVEDAATPPEEEMPEWLRSALRKPK